MFRLPISIMIEPTDLCNLKCFMCPRRERVLRQIRNGDKLLNESEHIMSFSLFKKIVNDLKNSEFIELDTIFMHWIGEPFLNPHYIKMLEYLGKEYKKLPFFKAVETHTNATLLTSEIIEELLALSVYNFPYILSFSIDANNLTTYKKIRQGNLKIVKNNIITLLDKRYKYKFHWPTLIFQFIVTQVNFKEVKSFINYWTAILKARKISPEIVYQFKHARTIDAIYIRNLDFGSKEEQAENNKLHQKALLECKIINKPIYNFISDKNPDKNFNSSKYRYCCVNMFNSAAIRFDGTFNLICDIFNRQPIGNLKNHSFDELWASEMLTYMRTMQIKGQISDLPYCKGCGQLLSLNCGKAPEMAVEFFINMKKRK